MQPPYNEGGYVLTSLTETDIRKSKLPVLIHENGMYALVVDQAAFNKMSNAEKLQFNITLKAQILHVIDINKRNPAFHDKQGLADYERQILDYKVSIAEAKLTIHSMVSRQFDNFSLVFLNDPADAEYDKFVNGSWEKRPENFTKFIGSFEYYHELAHALHDTKEPGSDYMAAVQTLIDNPDSRATLKLFADYRIISGAEERVSAVSHSDASSIVCAIAVNHALKLRPEQLAHLTALSPEERRNELFSVARGLDAAVKGYEEQAPQKSVKKALDERMSVLEHARKDSSYAAASKDLLENNCPFKKGTLAYEVLESLAAARERSKKNDYAGPSSPAPVMSPSSSYKDIRNSKLPVLIEQNGIYALVINSNVYNTLFQSEKDAYISEIRNHLLRFLEINQADPEFLQGVKYVEKAEDIKELMKGKFNENQSVPVFKNFSLVSLYDTDDAKEITQFLLNRKNLPKNFQEIVDNFIYNHELAHGLSRVGEAGSDYTGAVQTLIDNPDARAALQIIADFRTTKGVEGLAGKDRVRNHNNATEIAGGTAINAALALPAEELVRLAALDPAERRRALLRDSLEFDFAKNGYEMLGLERRILIELSQRRYELISAKKRFDEAAVARDLLENNCPFDRKSVTYKLLESLVAAREREYDNKYPELFATGKTGLQKEWLSAADPPPEKKEPEAIAPPTPVSPFKPR